MKVLPTTRCDYWKDEKGNQKKCGDVPACFYKSSVARWQYLAAKKHNPAGEVDDEVDDVEEKQVENVDDAFW